LGVIPEKLDKILAFAAVFQQKHSDEPDEDELEYSLVESAPNGWWYSCKLPNQQGKRLVIFYTDDNLPEAKTAKKPQGFIQLMQMETFYLTKLIFNNNYELNSKIYVTASGTTRLPNIHQFTSDRWTAVGDSAMAFDPLSSQGLFTALSSSRVCGQCIARCLSNNGQENDLLMKEYVDLVVKTFQEYITQYTYFYGEEKRWAENKFWTYRHSFKI